MSATKKRSVSEAVTRAPASRGGASGLQRTAWSTRTPEERARLDEAVLKLLHDEYGKTRGAVYCDFATEDPRLSGSIDERAISASLRRLVRDKKAQRWGVRNTPLYTRGLGGTCQTFASWLAEHPARALGTTDAHMILELMGKSRPLPPFL